MKRVKKYPEPWKRGAVYHFTIAENGRRRNISTGCTRKEDARNQVRQYVDLQAAGTAETFRIYSAPYFIWESCPRVARRLEEGKSIGRTHVRQGRALLDRWVLPDPIFPELPLRGITRGDVLDLRRRLRERITAGINTVNKAIAAVKTVLSEAAFRGDIGADPGAGVGNITYEQRERGIFEAAEVRAILEHKPGDMGKNPLADAAMTVLFCTGCRVGELRALRWGAVDLDTGRTRITEAFKSQREIGTTKWDKPREIVLPSLASDRLSAWREKSLRTEPDDFIFTIDGPAIGITWVRYLFTRVLAAAEADPDLRFKRGERWLTPHGCRHTINTLLLAAEVSPLLIETFLGWSSTEARVLGRIQRQYTHFDLLRLETVAEKIDELYGPAKQRTKKANAG